MRLNGWQRLWVFVSAAHLAVGATFTWLTMPTPDTITIDDVWSYLSNASQVLALPSPPGEGPRKTVIEPHGYKLSIPEVTNQGEADAYAADYARSIDRWMMIPPCLTIVVPGNRAEPGFCGQSSATAW